MTVMLACPRNFPCPTQPQRHIKSKASGRDHALSVHICRVCLNFWGGFSIWGQFSWFCFSQRWLQRSAIFLVQQYSRGASTI